MSTTTAPVETPDLLILPQGYWNDLSGEPIREVLISFLQNAAKNLEENPGGARYWRPYWQIAHKVSERHRACPFGHEQYVIQPDGTLGSRETNWDSGD